jgi:hypothetical protein
VKGPIVFAVTLAVLLATGTAIWLSSDGPDLLGPNGSPPEAFIADIPPGQEVCVGKQLIPEGAGTAIMTLGTYGRSGGEIAVIAKDANGAVTRGSAAFKEGVVVVPLRPSRVASAFCLKNTGKVKIAVAGRPTTGLSVAFPSSASTTWISSASEISHRFTAVRFAPLGALTMWAALLAAVAAGIVGIVAVLRAARSA